MSQQRILLRPLVGKKVTLTGICAEVHEHRKGRNVLIRTVRFSDGRYIADHLWVRVDNPTRKAITHPIVFTGTVVRYTKARFGISSSNYGLARVRILKGKLK